MTLVEFLTARLRDDEAAAKAWLPFGNPDAATREHIARHDPARVLAEVEAKRRIVEAESQPPEFRWKPDVGGDFTLSGDGYFANYWPDNTVSASIYPSGAEDGERLADSGIVKRDTMAACQAFAEQWISEHLAESRPVLRLLALPYATHSDYREEWRP